MTQEEYMNQVKTTEMPFLCGGYSQQDWDILTGAYVDEEYMDDYLDAPNEKYGYLVRATKPSWA